MLNTDLLGLLRAIAENRTSAVFPCCGLLIREGIRRGLVLRTISGRLELTQQGRIRAAPPPWLVIA